MRRGWGKWGSFKDVCGRNKEKNKWGEGEERGGRRRGLRKKVTGEKERIRKKNYEIMISNRTKYSHPKISVFMKRWRKRNKGTGERMRWKGGNLGIQCSIDKKEKREWRTLWRERRGEDGARFLGETGMRDGWGSIVVRFFPLLAISLRFPCSQ